MTGSNEALADACSGVVGTLVSLWCFYPIERIKTNLQAGKSLSSSTSSSSLWSSATEVATSKSKSEKDSDRIQRQIKALLDVIQQSFRGCLTKSMHATSSSFCYFYFYSWILSFHNNKRRRRLQMGSNNSTTNFPQELAPLRPSTRLVLSAIAAMTNTLFTLPLDVLSSKRTVESENDNNSKETDTPTTPENSKTENNCKAIMEKTWNSVEKNGTKSLPGLTDSTSSSSSSSSSSSTIEMIFHEACSRSEELFSFNDENEDNDNDNSNSNNTSTYSGNSTTSSTSILSINDEYKMRWKERQEQLKSRRFNKNHQLQQDSTRDDSAKTINAANITATVSTRTTNTIVASIRRWSKLWKGLSPALLLCSNPSIHYTIFDMLKAKTLAYKKLRNHRGIQRHQLSVSEAFVLGLLSKFVATIVTYPLIRAKVLMMVGGDVPAPSTDTTNTAVSNTTSASSATVSSPTLWSVLKQSYIRDGGIPGLYKGCDWQLMHTLLKSALMMAIREEITGSTRALFGVSSK
jgi:hypothetical protein